MLHYHACGDGTYQDLMFVHSQGQTHVAKPEMCCKMLSCCSQSAGNVWLPWRHVLSIYKWALIHQTLWEYSKNGLFFGRFSNKTLFYWKGKICCEWWMVRAECFFVDKISETFASRKVTCYFSSHSLVILSSSSSKIICPSSLSLREILSLFFCSVLNW